jgi:hypothetical protein
MAIDPKNKLAKANAAVAATSDDRMVWQEPFARYQTVPAGKSSQAPEILKGFAGSWAGQWALEESASTGGSVASGAAPAVQVKRNRLGHDGWPEINFRPYDQHTLMSGRNGPSLLGHPISFEFVGPTLKGTNTATKSNMDHQWSVTVGASEDTLTIDTVAFNSTFNTVVAPTYITVGDIYGITAIPNEGLYLYVLDSGSEGELVTQTPLIVGGGVGDGTLGQDNLITRNAGTPKDGNSKYEIFRVVDIAGDTLILDSGKRLSDYYTFGANPVIRAVALIKPAAARLAPVPGSGDKVFAFLPPKAALTGDFWPMAEEYPLGARLHPGYAFSENAGDPLLYQYAPPTPIPYSTDHFRAELPGPHHVLVVSDLGKWVVHATPGERLPAANDVGLMLRIRELDCTSGVTQWDALGIGTAQEDPGSDRILGYFEVYAVDLTPGSETWSIQAHPSWEMGNGYVWWPQADDHAFGIVASINTQQERAYVECSLHEQIPSLWERNHLSPEILEIARFKNIIDPAWAGMSAKTAGSQKVGINLARADKAAFDTSTSSSGAAGTNANPGSLLDLGFRPVFYPATKYGIDTFWSADFSNPIETRGEILIDPTLPAEDQWIRIDYSAGLVYLSHPAKVGVDGGLFPTGVDTVEADNARGEPFFFASFVPFSREPGQLGGNPRVAANDGTKEAGCTLGEGLADVYGERVFHPLYHPQTLTAEGSVNAVDVDRFELILGSEGMDAWDIPQSGWVTLVQGTGCAGEPLFMDDDGNEVSTFRYEGVTTFTTGGQTYLVLDNLSGSGQIGAGNFVMDGTNPVTAVWRKDIETSPSYLGNQGTDYRQDTTMGYAARASVLRFEGATVSRQSDGSVSIHTKDPQVDEHTALFEDLFSSWALDGLEVAANGNPNEVDIASGAFIMKGRRIESGKIAWGSSAAAILPNGADTYVYLRSDVDLCGMHPWASTTLPLPNADDILLARVQVDGGGVITGVQDLRRPLKDIDKRLDITVGSDPTGHPQPLSTHFGTLTEAIAYVDQLAKSGAIGSANGVQHRIQVVGGTSEPAASLPMTLPAIDGLIIEGANRRTDLTAPHTHAVNWGTTTNAALFEVDSDTGARYEFRNLTFVYDDGALGGSVNPTERIVFNLAAGSTMSDWTLDGISVLGINDTNVVHGFIYSATTGGIQNTTIRNCWIKATDFAVRVSSVLAYFLQNTIEQNLFEVGAVPQSVVGSAIIWGASNGGFSGHNRILNNVLEGGHIGISLEGDGDQVRGNRITDTAFMGIQLHNTAENISVVDNTLTGIHQSVAGGTYFAHKVGLAILDATSGHILRGNRITLAASGVGDRAIDAAASTLCIYSENVLADDMVWGSRSQVTDNIVATAFGASGFGADTTIRGNILTGTATLGDGVVFAGNLGVDVSVAGLGVSIEGNTLSGDIALSGGSDNCRITGNFVEGTSGISAMGQDNLISHNTLSNGTDTTLIAAGARCSVIGNIVLGDTTGDTLGISLDLGNKVQVRVEGNQFRGRVDGAGNLHQIVGNQAAAIDLTVTGGNLIANNLIQVDINLAGADEVVQGNRVVGDIICAGADNILDSNRVGSDITTQGVRLTARGNHVAGNITHTIGGSPTFMGNRAVNLSNTGAAPTIMGNTITAQLLNDAAGYVIIGNTVTDTVDTTGGGGVDPDVAAGVALGNRLDTSGLSIGTEWYSAATPVAASGDGPKQGNV